MTLNILIDVRSWQAGRQRLEAVDGVKVTDVTDTSDSESLSRALPVDLLAKQDVLFCTFPPTNHKDLKQVRLIQVTSAGYSQLLDLDLSVRGVRACNGSGVFDSAIAEWNVAMMVNLKRDLRQMIRNQEEGTWDRDRRFQREIRSSVVGFWGYGGLARQTARLCKAMGLTVHALTRSGVKQQDNRYVVPGTGDLEGKLPDRVFLLDQKEAFLGGLDFLVMGLPLNSATEGIVDDKALQMLPNHAVVLNPARGPLIQEQALIIALEQGWIAGAALDTHYHYPMPPDHRLWQFDNVIMTPHISGSAGGEYYLPRIWNIFLNNLARLIDGRPLINELTANQLAGQ